MNIVEKTDLERSSLKLRQIAEELRACAPAESLKASALATAVDLRVKKLEALQ